MNVKGIIFDKDGTLFDYYSAWAPIFREQISSILDAVERPDDRELEAKILKMLGIGEHGVHPGGIVFRANQASIVLSIWNFARKERISFRKLMASFKENYYGSRDMISRTLPNAAASKDLHALFSRLRNLGYKLGIVTSDNRESTELCLQVLGIKGDIDFISTFDDGYPKKPKTGSFTAFCSAFQLKASEVAVIGDAPVDMKYGKKAGAGYRVAVLTGSKHIKQLSRYAHVIYDNLDHLQADPVLFPDQAHTAKSER